MDGEGIITSSTYFAAKAAEIGLKRLALKESLGEVEFGVMRLKVCEDGKLVVVLSSAAEVKVMVGGNVVEIIPL